MKIKNKILLLLLVFVLLPSGIYSYNNYIQMRTVLMDAIDNRLYTAATMAKATLPDNYHDQIINSTSVSQVQFDAIVDKFNKLCAELDMEYLWSLIEIDGKIYFTSSTSPDKNAVNQKHAKFFELHSNPEAYKEVFSTQTTQYQTIEDKWGKLRTVLIPFRDRLGRRYLFGASMEVSRVDELLKQLVERSIYLSVAFLIISFLLSFLFASMLSVPFNKLVKETSEIASGNLDKIISEKGSYEEAALAQSVNRMNRSIREHIASLQESEEKLRRITNNLIGSFIYRHDTEGIFNYVSSSITRVLGFTPQEFSKHYSTYFTDHPVNEMAQKHSSLSIKGIQQPPYEVEIYHKDGEIYRLEVVESPVFDQSGKVVAVEGIAHDITQRKKSEWERERLLKTLKFKNKELEDVVYTASHDFKSPLVNIDGFSCELKEDCEYLLTLLAPDTEVQDKPKEVQELIENRITQSLGIIRSNVKKLTDLLDGLLEISTIGTCEINKTYLNVNEIVDDVLLNMKDLVNRQSVSVEVDQLPGCTADPQMLKRIFFNLIDNALKYHDQGKESVITISGRVEGDMSVYCVADNGIGINPMYQSKVFEIFHRLNPGSGIAGTGLGLTITTRMLDRMDGSIRVISDVGKGSKFFVSLPEFSSKS